jgi:hypothetical protein
MTRLAFLVSLLPILSGCGKQYIMARPSPHDFRSYELGDIQSADLGEPFIRVEAGFGFRLFEVTPAIQPPSFTSLPLPPWPDGKRLLLKASSSESSDELYLEDPETSNWISVSSDGRILRGWVSPADASSLPGGNWPERARFRDTGEVLKTEGAFLGLLFFTGLSGNTLALSYREYPQGAAGPSFSEDHRYDLSESMTIRFRSLEIEILEADEASLTFRVLSDGGLPWLERRK